MKSTEKGVLETSELYFFSPSQTAKRLYFYPISTGHFFAVNGYHLIRNDYDSLLITHIIRGSFTYVKDGKHSTAHSGETVILDCFKEHEYYTRDSFESIWVHLNGSNCVNLYHEIENMAGNTVCCKSPQLVEEILFNVHNVLGGEKTMPESRLSMELYHLMTELLLAQNPSGSQTMRYDSLVRDIKYYVSTHLNENLSVKALAERGYMSVTNFSRVFKQQTGISPYEYVLISRLNKAKELLRQTDMSISQIAAAVGFNSDSNFIHFFSQNTGISPKSFRKLEF